MQHLPIERLALKDGRIFELYNGKLSNPFMAFSELHVTKKLAVKERGQGECEFSFELSCPPDPIWVAMLREDLDKTPIEFQGDRMHLTCLPANLEQTYLRIKDSMTKTNARYAIERKELIARIVAKDEALNVARKKQEDRAAAVQDQFDKLQL